MREFHFAPYMGRNMIHEHIYDTKEISTGCELQWQSPEEKNSVLDILCTDRPPMTYMFSPTTVAVWKARGAGAMVEPTSCSRLR